MFDTIPLLSKHHTPLLFGGASVSGEGGGYGFGDISKADSLSLLRHAFDRGIKVFDTAPIYGFGESERRIGAAFKDKREDVFIISKCGVTWHDTKRVNMTNDPQTTKKMIEQSLRDLGSDYIDLYMVHWPDAKTDIRKTLEVIAKAKIEGRIKHIGLCNSNRDEFEKASEIDTIECLQSQLNFFERDEIENSIKIAREHKIPFMSWGTLDKGILTGRVKEKRLFDKSDCRSWAPWWKKSNKNWKIEKFKAIEEVLRANGHNGLELALHFNLNTQGVSHVLCGMKKQSDIDAAMKALENPISQELLQELSQIIQES